MHKNGEAATPLALIRGVWVLLYLYELCQTVRGSRMSDENKEVEAVEKYYNLMMELKVSITELAGKIDSLTDLKEMVTETKKTSDAADYRSNENEKDIAHLQEKMSTKASKDEVDLKADKSDVERIVKEKDNWKRVLPAWVAVIVAVIALLQPYFN